MTHHATAQAILTAVANQYGIKFHETMTGGGCMALEARLESGHWIVATDENLSAFSHRIEHEGYADNYNSHDGDDHRACGWSIGIYPNNATDDGDTWMSGGDYDAIVNIVDYDAYAADLPALVGRALAAVVGNQT